MLERAIARGELPAGADPFAYEEVAAAVLILRMINGQPADEPYLQRLIDDVLIPALAHPPSSPDPDTAPALSARICAATATATSRPRPARRRPQSGRWPPTRSVSRGSLVTSGSP